LSIQDSKAREQFETEGIALEQQKINGDDRLRVETALASRAVGHNDSLQSDEEEDIPVPKPVQLPPTTKNKNKKKRKQTTTTIIASRSSNHQRERKENKN
jgi:hypothetical protein